MEMYTSNAHKYMWKHKHGRNYNLIKDKKKSRLKTEHKGNFLDVDIQLSR